MLRPDGGENPEQSGVMAEPNTDSQRVRGRLAIRRHVRQGGGVKRKGLQVDGDQKADRDRQLVRRTWED